MDRHRASGGGWFTVIASDDLAARISLLGCFDVVVDGHRVTLPLGAQRLLALLALRDTGTHRAVAAELLWPDSRPGRAAANLRSALWRARRIGETTVIECAGPRLRLVPAVDVDQRSVLLQAREVTDLADTPVGVSGVGVAGHVELVGAFSRGLLPDWMDDWLVLDQERWDQVRLHALETLARKLISAEKYLPALEAAFAAVEIEPVRESAHRTVVEVYLAEGNSACALKYYHRYRGLVQRELGVAPSLRMTRLVHQLVSP